MGANKYNVTTINLDGNNGLDRPRSHLYTEYELAEVREILKDFVDYSYIDVEEYPDPVGMVEEWDGESPIYFESTDGESVSVDIVE